MNFFIKTSGNLYIYYFPKQILNGKLWSRLFWNDRISEKKINEIAIQIFTR